MPRLLPWREHGAAVRYAVHILRYLVDGALSAVENDRNPATPRALSGPAKDGLMIQRFRLSHDITAPCMQAAS